MDIRAAGSVEIRNMNVSWSEEERHEKILALMHVNLEARLVS
jgi:hypothetical protein